MKVWLIETCNTNGKDFLVHAFEHKRTCELRCEEKHEEWMDFNPFEADGELLPIKDGVERIIIKRTVYDLDRTDVTEEIKRRAKEKLNPEEIEVLGLND